MKQVKNKMTGDIGELDFDSKEGVFIVVRYDLLTKVTSKSYYKNLKDLNEEWEDYEEPKEHWTIGHDGAIFKLSEWENQKDHEEIGNYFETKEEAELAVRKLKAWKRLKDKGFRFYSWDYEFDMVDKPAQTVTLRASAVDSSNTDLDLLFGGEE